MGTGGPQFVIATKRPGDVQAPRQVMPEKTSSGINSQGNSYTTYSNGNYSYSNAPSSSNNNQGSHYYGTSSGGFYTQNGGKSNGGYSYYQSSSTGQRSYR